MTGARLNLASDLIDRHLIAGRGEALAIAFEDDDGFTARYAYRELAVLANRFAYVLRGLGVAPGDRVLFALPAHPALAYGILGCARMGAVAVLAPPPGRDPDVAAQLLRWEGTVATVTTADRVRELEAAAAHAPSVREFLVVDDAGEREWVARKTGPRALGAALAGAPDHLPAVALAAEHPALSFATRGSDPVAYLHSQRFGRSHDRLIEQWLDLRPGDVCAGPDLGDPAWYLPVAALLLPLRAGAATFLHRRRRGELDPARWLETAGRNEVSVLIGTPDTYLRLVDSEPSAGFSPRRAVASGAPLTDELRRRVEAGFGCVPLDGLGAAACGVYAHERDDVPSAAGSCGRVADGFEIVVLDEGGRLRSDPRASGELAVRETTPGRLAEGALSSRPDGLWPTGLIGRLEAGDVFLAAPAITSPGA